MTDVAVLDSYNYNCTDTVYIECNIAYWLWRTIPFTLLPIGLLGNILNFVVLSRQRMRRNSTTVYLLFLAGTDIIFLLFGLLPDTVYCITGIRYANYSKGFCRIRLWILYTSGAFSVWLLVLLTLERVLLTKAPLVTKHKLTPKTSFGVSVTTLVLLILANIHCITGFKHHSSEEEMQNEFGKELLEVLHYPCTYATKEYMTFFTGTWGLVILTVFNILPAMIIIIGNIIIAVDIIMRRKRLKKVNPTNQTLSTIKQQNETSLRVLPSNHGEMSIDCHETITAAGPPKQTNVDTSSLCVSQQSGKPDTSARKHTSKPIKTAVRVKKSHSPTRMLFTLTIFFIVTTFPYTSYFVLKARLSDLNESEIAKWRLITVVALICGWCNYTFNFFLYFVSGTLFKQEWNRLLQEGKLKFHSIFG